jgi:molybdopterin/thiamine biosynthesis adenylyltransferase
LETLARLGVGTLRVVDPDVFEEHNLNRQLLCTLSTLGMLRWKRRQGGCGADQSGYSASYQFKKNSNGQWFRDPSGYGCGRGCAG